MIIRLVYFLLIAIAVIGPSPFAHAEDDFLMKIVKKKYPNATPVPSSSFEIVSRLARPPTPKQLVQPVSPPPGLGFPADVQVPLYAGPGGWQFDPATLIPKKFGIPRHRDCAYYAGVILYDGLVNTMQDNRSDIATYLHVTDLRTCLARRDQVVGYVKKKNNAHYSGIVVSDMGRCACEEVYD